MSRYHAYARKTRACQQSSVFLFFVIPRRRRFAETIKLLVALSILFSYGLQFCVPSEIVWNRLEPWLAKRRKNNQYFADNGATLPSSVAVNTIAGSTMTTTTAMTTTSNMTIDEKKQLEKTSSSSAGKKEKEPFEAAYYVMRAIMILGTGTV